MLLLLRKLQFKDDSVNGAAPAGDSHLAARLL